ncbi:type II toxin-antitoxin system VapC family toxin [Pedobacter glucosidilyticus]|uniref:type II toxin-antitoxin system VapC family toxin n=1 Tax=Pedobacter glucosidilyticus TaxID=1122941 RepID=UPI000422FAFA|nr:PIN domain-containing protein [Pedobacter glucosidilyticus]
MNIFLDANILVSVLNKEYPLFTYSSRILSLANLPRYKLYTSPVCLAIAFYFAEKKSKSALAKQKIATLCEYILIADNTSEAVQKALINKASHDFEDGLEYYAALEKKCSCIITENKEDFYFSEIEVLSSKEFFDQYMLKN